MRSLTHGDECPCQACAEKRMRHETMVREMQATCPGCSLGQPYDGHCHTETMDLTDMMCVADPIRKAMDKGFADGSILRRHGYPCDCPLCLRDPGLWKTARPA